MKEQFDKDLAKKIKDSFTKYEEPYDPKAWDRLSKAYFKPKKSAWAVFWPFITSGLAASLFMAVILWPETVEDTSTFKVADSSKSISKIPDKLDPTIDQDNKLLDREDSTRSDITPAPFGDGIIKSKRKITPYTPAEHSTRKNIYKDPLPIAEEIPKPSEIDLSSIQMEPTDTIQAPYVTESKGLNLTTGKDSTYLGRDRRSVMAQEEALELLEKWKNLTEDNVGEKIVKEPLPFKLGVLVAPQASSNPVAGMNLGAGLMSEFSLSKKIKLDVGVTYARLSMNPENQRAMPQTMDMAMARSYSNFINSSYQLDFASLDIPVNLKYQVMETKNSGFYLITGLSSMVYLNQQATESFQTNSFFTTEADGVLSFSPSVQQFSTVITPESGDNNVDLGRMVNLSVGYEYNLSDGMFISFEPFYKLPIGSLTFANQQFSIGGLNLRMNFKMGK